MPQNAEANAFLARVAQLPPGLGVNLDDVLQPSIEDEAALRQLFAQDKANSRLEDPYVGLVDVFDAPDDIRTTRARVVENEHDLSQKYIMPLSKTKRRKEGTPCMVNTLEDFQSSWSVFTEASLSLLTDWSNVIAAGGAVQACLAPIPGDSNASKRDVRRHFHSKAFPTSDVDLFLYGLTPEQAEVKIEEIYKAVRDSIPWDVVCIRTKHTVSIHSQYPYRAIQIVLRLYQSPAEILAGFDVDAPCCAYDGNKVWANPRAIVAMMRQCNTVDITRRSPSYEVRLSKYASRGFEIYVPQLTRDNIDPTIFERSIVRIQGLARLLVLERLATADNRDDYLLSRRTLRGRPDKPFDWKRRAKKKYKGDLKQNADAGLELSDYDVVTLHIPYGPGWNARRIGKLVYATDLAMNSSYNPKNKDRHLHRHPAYFGNMKECMENCCEYCPEPQNDEERALQEEEDKSYVRDRISFMEEDPGRQSMSGSFNPIDDGEWSEQAYIGATEKFFTAIAAHDRRTVQRMLKEGVDPDRRDHVGRTPLQVAILSKAEDIACDLVDADARMTSRLVDGRTALHLAAQSNSAKVVRKLLERSAINAEETKKAKEKGSRAKDKDEDSLEIEDDTANAEADDDIHDSSEDDWSSADEEKKEVMKEQVKPGEVGLAIPEDEDVPDVFEINVQDWDYGFTALNYAVVEGSIQVLDLLLTAGADPKIINHVQLGHETRYSHPLVLTAATNNEDVACQIAEKLVHAGAITSEADDNLNTVLHRMVSAGRPRLVSTFLRTDPNARAVLDIPIMVGHNFALFPIVSAIISGSYSVLALLLAYGAKIVPSVDDFERAKEMKARSINTSYNRGIPQNFQQSVWAPFEVALALQDDVIHLLAAVGADFNAPIKDTAARAIGDGRMTSLDFVATAAERITQKIQENRTRPTLGLLRASAVPLASAGLLPMRALPVLGLARAAPLASVAAGPVVPSAGTSLIVQKPPEEPRWKLDCLSKIHTSNEISNRDYCPPPSGRPDYARLKAYFDEAEALLKSHGAKTAIELNPDPTVGEPHRQQILSNRLYAPNDWQPTNAFLMNQPFSFWRLSHSAGQVALGWNLYTLYEDLYTACWNGDNNRIQELCLPQKDTKTIPDTPLVICVRWGDGWRGFTPLHIAVAQRNWGTAKLIIAIAMAQYKPAEPQLMTMTWTIAARTVQIGYDSDFEPDESDSESDEEETEAEEPVNFVDIAKRPSAVHSPSHPVDMLTTRAPFLDKDGLKPFSDTLVSQAIIQDDFEVFIQLLDLCSFMNQGPTRNRLGIIGIMGSLLLHDRPDMLDEYIRRTGEGISLAGESGSQDQNAQTSTSKSKLYLGLNINGKKRKDLAMKGDPNAPTQSTPMESLPMLWTAAQNGLVNTIKYLAGDRPLAAYKFYASSHSNERARLIKTIPDLPAVLPVKLGWTSSPFNESALLAAIVGKQQDSLETLFSLRPREMEGFARMSHKTLEFNSVLAAVRWGCDIATFDYLLGKKISPMEADYKGRNIYHLLCLHSSSEVSLKLLKHAVHQLPKEMTEFLLRQQTKDTRNTPLHMAVKTWRLDLVRILADLCDGHFLQRDANGLTPLQVAVKNSHPEITRIIAAAGPAEALMLEDGVGNTALETAARQAFIQRQATVSGAIPTVHYMPPNVEWNRPAVSIDKLEKELIQLRETIQTLLDEGRLINGTKLAKDLLEYAAHLEGKIAKDKAAAESEKLASEATAKWTEEKDIVDPTATLRVLLEAIAARPSPRRLVHLNDVHESVQKALQAFSAKKKDKNAVPAWRRRRGRRGRQVDDDEDDEEPAAPTTSALTMYYDQSSQMWADVWHKL